MFRWVIHGKLVAGPRPGFGGRRGRQVGREKVKHWIKTAKKRFGIKSVICLLDEQHLRLYEKLPCGLVSYYEQKGLAVAHVPAPDRRHPALSARQQREVWQAYKQLRKPVLVHCSAGVSRTGSAVGYIKKRIEAK